MVVAHLHRDVKEKGYLSGVWAAIRNRTALAHEFARYLDGDSFRYGWHDFDPHTIDIAFGGMPVARIESHHDREEIDVYLEHPKAAKFIEEAIMRGYNAVEKKPSS